MRFCGKTEREIRLNAEYNKAKWEFIAKKHGEG